jgi:hypothetical protein
MHGMHRRGYSIGTDHGAHDRRDDNRPRLAFPARDPAAAGRHDCGARQDGDTHTRMAVSGGSIF